MRYDNLQRILLSILLASMAFRSESAYAAAGPSIHRVTVTRSSFNAVAGESTILSASFDGIGQATATVLDRDGRPIKHLGPQQTAPRRASQWIWNGVDNSGAIVADEAYSFRIDWTDGRHKASYAPAVKDVELISIPPEYYDRRGGTLAYELPAACRVHIQAGVTTQRKNAGDVDGVVLKTIVNREPRGKGAVAEHWDGMDASGTIFVPDMGGFVIAIAATRLPENSVITFGNRRRRFADEESTRTGNSSVPNAAVSHPHHRGLGTLDDLSPDLRLEIPGARWSAADRAWITSSTSVQLSIKPIGPAAGHFGRQPGTIYLFVNQRERSHAASDASATSQTINSGPLDSGLNVITVNWVSEWGPLAVNSVRVLVAKASKADVQR